ncbi:hypothetical protein DB347_24945 [Opitutaceae bacterium EW11]|nr:hypothetical protein DB347_24945 [Opitutaceae bacterium EW11]
MNALRPIEIVGGGLAGLSMGLTLQRRGVPTTVFEAGEYPRHRVCGEFLAGLDDRTVQQLGIGDLLQGARSQRRISWHRKGHIWRQTLARPAFSISRHQLDARFARAFEQAGGQLRARHRVDQQPAPEGRVFGSGRNRGESGWLGLKLHVRGLRLDGDLEIHLGHQAYVGLCDVDDGLVNVCGLFRIRPGVPVDRLRALINYLAAARLSELSDRVRAAEIDPDSCCAVAGLRFGPADAAPDRIRLGDAIAMTPPFTGNGMAMALQSAECAAGPLEGWARGEYGWETAVRVATKALHNRFRRRLRFAAWLHPFVLSPTRQSLFRLTVRLGILPIDHVTATVHA